MSSHWLGTTELRLGRLAGLKVLVVIGTSLALTVLAGGSPGAPLGDADGSLFTVVHGLYWLAMNASAAGPLLLADITLADATAAADGLARIGVLENARHCGSCSQ
jgi:hypothetical protein